jgi:hypothetical protein
LERLACLVQVGEYPPGKRCPNEMIGFQYRM